MNKKNYVSPKIEYAIFDATDVVLTSVSEVESESESTSKGTITDGNDNIGFWPW